MNFSAASSSSAVVTPGRALAAQHPQAAGEDLAGRGHLVDLLGGLADDHAAIRSASAQIASSSSSRSVARMRRISSPTSSGRPRAVDAAQEALLLVVVDQRLGLLVVLVEPVADHLGLVVVADDQLGCRRCRRRPPASGGSNSTWKTWPFFDAGAAPAEPAHDLVVGDVDQERRGQLAAELAQLRVERLGLRHGAREAVEDEAVGGLLALDPLGDHADDHLVGDQVAAVHVLLRLLAELGPLARPRRAGCRRSRSRAAGSPPAGARPGSPCRTPGGPSRTRFSSGKPGTRRTRHFRKPS